MSEALALHGRVHLGARVKAQLLQAFGAAYRASATGRSADDSLQTQSQDHEDLRAARALLSRLTRSAQPPASTFDADWAAPLAQPVVQPFLDLVRDEGSVALQLPLTRYTFDGKALKVPLRVPGSTPDLAGAWRGEGQPIRVGALSLTFVSLAPTNLAVIGTATLEMIKAAGDDVMQEVIRQAIVVDSTQVLEATFFDSEAATDERPAGIGHGLDAANTAPSTGSTPAQIAADLKGRLDAMVAAGFGGPRSRWAMNTTNAAVMATHFAEVQTRGTYLGVPIVSGPSMPSDVVYLIDGSGVAFASDLPQVDGTSEAVLHEETDPDAVAPIVDDGGVAASPARSLYQTNATALRSIWEVNWTAAAGAVQAVTGVAW